MSRLWQITVTGIAFVVAGAVCLALARSVAAYAVASVVLGLGLGSLLFDLAVFLGRRHRGLPNSIA